MALNIQPGTPSWAVTLISELNQLFFQPPTSPARLPTYTVAQVSALNPARWKGCHINVSDETGGFTGAYSDGASWRRYADRAVVS